MLKPTRFFDLSKIQYSDIFGEIEFVWDVLNKLPNYETRLVKLGAILGDEVEIGCNCVLNPGTVIGKRTLTYANCSLFGYYPSDSIIKLRQSYEVVDRRN